MLITFSKEAIALAQSEQFFKPEVYNPENIRTFLNPNIEQDAHYIQGAIQTLPLSEQAALYRQIEGMIEEVWQIREHQNGQPTREFIDSYQPLLKWVLFPGKDLPFPVLPQEDHEQVLISRSFPILSQAECDRLKHARIACMGLSTGLIPAVGLFQVGVRDLEAGDPDVISTSNLNRMYGATITDVGIPKAKHAARLLLGINPYANVTTRKGVYSPDELERLLLEKDIIIEMIDRGSDKSTIRELQKQLSEQNPHAHIATICMGTNTAWQAIISHETATDPLFLRSDLNKQDVDALHHQRENPLGYLQALVKVVGVDKIPTRQIINLMLQSNPEYRYLAQHGPNAFINGGILVRKILAVLNEQSHQPETLIDVDSILRINTSGQDDNLLHELQTNPRTASIFAPFSSLDQAALKFCQSMGIEWQPPHSSIVP